MRAYYNFWGKRECLSAARTRWECGECRRRPEITASRGLYKCSAAERGAFSLAHRVRCSCPIQRIRAVTSPRTPHGLLSLRQTRKSVIIRPTYGKSRNKKKKTQERAMYKYKIVFVLAVFVIVFGAALPKNAVSVFRNRKRFRDFYLLVLFSNGKITDVDRRKIQFFFFVRCLVYTYPTIFIFVTIHKNSINRPNLKGFSRQNRVGIFCRRRRTYIFSW